MKSGPLSCLLILSVGCKYATSHDTKAASQSSPSTAAQSKAAPRTASKWVPVTRGFAYQLSLKNGVFGFCDNAGPRQIDLTTGRQTAGSFPCDRKNDAIRDGCDNEIYIIGPPDAPYDVVSAEGYSFKLHGHVRDCDRDGDLVIVSTMGEIALMNASTDKIAFLEADVPDTVVLGSGWAAWNSQDKHAPLRLEKTSVLLRRAVTPPND